MGCYNKWIRPLSLKKVREIARIDELLLQMQKKPRPDYGIFAYLTTGNNFGEKRIFQSMIRQIKAGSAERYILGVEGYAGDMIFKCLENYAAVTQDTNYRSLFNYMKNQSRGWDFSDDGGLKDIITLMVMMYEARPELKQADVVEAIDDCEEKGVKPCDQINKVIEDKGMGAFEAFALMNKKIGFYGLEDVDLFKIQWKLSYGTANEHFYRVAKLRSRAMFNNLIDLMDKEKRSRALVYITGFHHMVFEELTKANGIRYEYEFVTKLPRYEPSEWK